MSKITIHDLNDKQRAMIPDAVRASLGTAAITSTEAQRRYARTQEKKMHEEFEQWLNLHRDELYWDHSRMDKATSNRKGHPDFAIVAGGLALMIEFKVPGGALSEDQRETHAWLESVASPAHVCHAVADAIALARKLIECSPEQ